MAIFIYFLDVHFVAEWSDLQFVQESCVSGFDLLSLGDDFLVNNDFNLGLNNLGLDTQLLEKAGLLWIKTS